MTRQPLTPVQAQRLRKNINNAINKRSRELGVSADELRTRFAFERLLCRVFADISGTWMLKGGTALLIRTGGGRHTKDIDLSRAPSWQDDADLTAELTKITNRDVSDPFYFKNVRVTDSREDPNSNYGHRTAQVKMELWLHATKFESLSLDISERRHTQEPGQIVQVIPDINIPILHTPAFTVLVNSIESHLADKICAMYESHNGSPSTRFRDLPDIIRITETCRFSAAQLSENLSHEQKRRKMRLPSRIESPGENWDTQYQKTIQTYSGISQNAVVLKDALELADHCFHEILAGTRNHGSWNPQISAWET